MDMKDTHVVVTGGAGALGAVIADALLESGAAVTVLDKVSHERVWSLQCDLADAEQVAARLDEAQKRYGPIEGLVLCAGAFSRRPHDALRNNFLTALHPLRRVLPFMLNRNTGSVVALTSDYAVSSVPGVTAFAAAKAAVNGLMREAAQRCAHSEVRVNTLLLGVNTGGHDMPGAGGEVTPELNQILQTPFTPQLCVQNVLFLLSDASAGITGQQLRLDGGMQAVAHAPMLLFRREPE